MIGRYGSTEVLPWSLRVMAVKLRVGPLADLENTSAQTIVALRSGGEAS